jgi:hypothetical protein
MLELEIARYWIVGSVPRTSNGRTVNLDSDTSFKPSKSLSFVSSWFLRVVATTGQLVVCRIRRVRWKPMPLEAGVIRAHGCIVNEQAAIAERCGVSMPLFMYMIVCMDCMTI